MKVAVFITIAVLTASSAFVQEANPEEAALCSEGQFCSDDYGLQTHSAVSLLQRGAKRLLNAVQPPQPNVASTSNDAVAVAVEHLSPSDKRAYNCESFENSSGNATLTEGRRSL